VNEPSAFESRESSWSEDLFAALLCVVVGLALAILPHVIWWQKSGDPNWIADDDEVLYLTIASQSYFEHPSYISDPSSSESKPTYYPWLQFVPAVLIAKGLGLGPLGIAVVWRVWAGVSLPLGWYLLLRQHIRNKVLVVGLTIFLLADSGLTVARPLVGQVRALAATVGPLAGEVPSSVDVAHQWRLITPGLSLFFLLAYSAALARARANPTRGRIAVAAFALGLLFYAYFYFWTTALLALALNWMLDPGSRSAFGKILIGGGILGLPAVAGGYHMTHLAPTDWLIRTEFLEPIPRCSALLWPRISLGVLAITAASVFRDRRELLSLWTLAVAGLLLTNHQLVTGAQMQNDHWLDYAASPAVTALIVTLAASRLAAPRRRTVALLAVLSALHLASGFFLRAIQATRASDTARIMDAYRTYRAQRQEGSSRTLSRDSVLAGESRFVALAGMLEDQRILFGYGTFYSPSVSDLEWEERIALDGVLRGESRTEFELEQASALEHDLYGPWTHDPVLRRERLATRLRLFDGIAKDPEPACKNLRVRYVALPVTKAPPSYLVAGWTLLEQGPTWQIWERSGS
jgi:hypothetical protein